MVELDELEDNMIIYIEDDNEEINVSVMDVALNTRAQLAWQGRQGSSKKPKISLDDRNIKDVTNPPQAQAN